MKWTVLEKPEEMRLNGKPIWVYAKHENGLVCYCNTKRDVEESISGRHGLTYGFSTTEATPLPPYSPYKRIPDVREEMLRLKRDGELYPVHSIGVNAIWVWIRAGNTCCFGAKEAFRQFEYKDGTPFGEVKE